MLNERSQAPEPMSCMTPFTWNIQSRHVYSDNRSVVARGCSGIGEWITGLLLRWWGCPESRLKWWLYNCKIQENHWIVHLEWVNFLFKKNFITRTYSIAQGTLLNVMWQPGWEEIWGRMHTCVGMAESLCCSPWNYHNIVNWLCVCAQSCLTLCDPMDYTVHGILQARILEWVAVPFFRGSSQPRDRTQVSRIAGIFFTSWATRVAHQLDIL